MIDEGCKPPFVISGWIKGEHLPIETAPHERLKISGVEIRMRKLGRQLNLEKIHPHKFRRTMATRAIER